MRKTMNISLPESMFSFIQEKGRFERYGSASEYIRDLVRSDWVQSKPKQRTRRANDYFVRRDDTLMKNEEGTPR